MKFPLPASLRVLVIALFLGAMVIAFGISGGSLLLLLFGGWVGGMYLAAFMLIDMFVLVAAAVGIMVSGRRNWLVIGAVAAIMPALVIGYFKTSDWLVHRQWAAAGRM